MPAPSLASRIRSSMTVRLRNQASTSRTVSPFAPWLWVGTLVTMNDTA